MPYLRTPGRGGGRRGPGGSGRVAPGPLPAPRRAEELGPQFPQFLYLGAVTHSHSASRPASPAFGVQAVRASCRLTQLRCWVVPGRDSSSSASSVRRVPSLHSSVSLRLVYTWPLFLHTSAGVNPAGSVPGVQEAARWAAGADSVGTSPPQTAPVLPHQRCWRHTSIRRSVPVREDRRTPRQRQCVAHRVGRSGPGHGGSLPTHSAGLCRGLGAKGLPALAPPKPAASPKPHHNLDRHHPPEGEEKGVNIYSGKQRLTPLRAVFKVIATLPSLCK